MINTVYKICLGICSVLALAIVIMLIIGYRIEVGPLVMTFVVLLAIGIRAFPPLKGFTYTVCIFASITAAMFYPQYFVNIGSFQFTSLIIPLLQIIMFGMGTTISFNDFIGVVKMPKGVFIGMLLQFTIMPIVGFILANVFRFPNEIAAGVVLIGSSPCGLASNVMNYIAGNNIALSVTLTAFSTIVAPILTPLLMKFLAHQFITVSFVDMMITVFKIVILPVIAGLIFNKLAHGRAKWLNRFMPILSMAGIVYIATIITAAGRDNYLTMGIAIFSAAVLHNAAGYFFGYWASRLFRLDKISSRTIAIEVGLQNGGMASGIALTMGKLATMGLPPNVFGVWMNISGSVLANWWRKRPVKE